MATALQKVARPSCRLFTASLRRHSSTTPRLSPHRFAPKLAYISGAGVGLYILWKYSKTCRFVPQVHAKEKEEEKDVTIETAAVRTQRELRFLSFASVQHKGAIYMTPQDFLESITEEMPRPRTGREHLQAQDVANYIKNTPPRHKGSSHLFRNIHNKGLISYTEYLFLLCVLTKPRSGFRIAFNMFDTDGNQRVDKKEFLVLQHVIAGHRDSAYQLSIAGQNEDGSVQDTTLLVHFFGKRGNEVLKFEDFQSFMENLQSEVLELEYEFAKGMNTITEEEFAKILLRYTILSGEDQEEYIERLRKRIPHVQGISFQSFKDFGQFLNNLDNFSVAMRLYTYSNHAMTEDEFQRAVKVCTGFSLDNHLVHTVFQLFDVDGDGHLSSKEFMSVMRDRLHRGFKSHSLYQSKWDAYKSCLKKEMTAT